MRALFLFWFSSAFLSAFPLLSCIRVIDFLSGERNDMSAHMKGKREEYGTEMKGDKEKFGRRNIPSVVRIDDFPEGDFLVWLGHSSFLIKLDGFVFYTDPVFSDRIVIIKRLIPFPVERERLPHPDFVLISHNHYDHMDIPSLVFLSERAKRNGKNPIFFVPEKASPPLKKKGIYVSELKWGEKFVFEKNGRKIVVESVRVKHFSGRGLFDYNLSKWNGYLVQGSLKIFFAGDTAFWDVGPLKPDIALMPIGAWKPRWFMKRNHVSPCEAVEMARMMSAKLMIPMHYGTFRQGLDSPEESISLMRKCAKEKGVSIIELDVGEILNLSKLRREKEKKRNS